MFKAADNSNNMTNLNGAEQLHNGFTPSGGYDVYVFEAETAGFDANDLLNFTSSLPNGTFAFGFGEDAAGKPFASPFTEAGLTDTPPANAPEPASLLLLGTGLLASGSCLGVGEEPDDRGGAPLPGEMSPAGTSCAGFLSTRKVPW